MSVPILSILSIFLCVPCAFLYFSINNTTYTISEPCSKNKIPKKNICVLIIFIISDKNNRNSDYADNRYNTNYYEVPLFIFHSTTPHKPLNMLLKILPILSVLLSWITIIKSFLTVHQLNLVLFACSYQSFCSPLFTS